MPFGSLSYTDSLPEIAPNAPPADFCVSTAPLVFLHGSGCDSSDWEAVVAALPPAKRCIRLDFRGHGQSDVPASPFTLSDLASDALALSDHLKLDRFVVVGHSLGGMVALELAARCERVAALVLVEGWTRLLAYRAFEGERTFGRLGATEVAAIKAKREATQQRFLPEVWGHFWRSVERFDGGPYLARATVPICEIYGSIGRVPATEAGLLVPRNRHIRLIWLAGGHFLPLEVPRQIAQLCAAAAAVV